MFHEYPKALYLRGWDDLSASVTVQDASGEADARAAGYRMLSEPEPAAAAPVVETAADDREALLARAEALGVDVDKRWGVARLRAALDAAE
jgi:hypothetical protein